ncbi:MAG: DUF2281 domain-containing protein [Phormidium sp. BM_Day4_Bin.17]|nr:DUF2281 domain-containing protein [Phormidium sp. BM_Day4_Bin.17]UCJ13738.1 MAG: DUF2281 domain-containing protein [Phormidium sp. PBR-2020]
MTVKEKLLEKIEQLSEAELAKVLEFVSVHLESQSSSRKIILKTASGSRGVDIKTDAAWQAYLKSEQEREEVYRRLANS